MLPFKKITLGLFLSLSMSQLQYAEPKTVVFGCRGWGFFAEFLWIINHLDWAIKNDKKPVVYWGMEFAYYSTNGFNGQTNAWEYYFKQVSDDCYQVGDKIINDRFHKGSDNFCALWNYPQYIVHLSLLPNEERGRCIQVTNRDYYEQYEKGHKNPVGEKHLYDPKFRAYIKSEIIDRYIKLQPWITKKIDHFYKSNMQEYNVIGIHLRGNFLGPEVGTVPLDVIFETANQLNDGNCRFFIATDQQPLLEQARQKLNGDIIFYETERYEKTTSPSPRINGLHPKMGEDVLIETLLLSHCDYLVHTLSNVSTAALYFNPTMKHTLLY